MIHWVFLGNINGILMGTSMWDMNSGHWWRILYQHHLYTWTNMDMEATAFRRFLYLLTSSTSPVTLVSIIPIWDVNHSSSTSWSFKIFKQTFADDFRGDWLKSLEETNVSFFKDRARPTDVKGNPIARILHTPPETSSLVLNFFCHFEGPYKVVPHNLRS